MNNYRPATFGSMLGSITVAILLLIQSPVDLKGQIFRRGADLVNLYVLDFDNISGDPRTDWLSKALKDMILLRLEDEPRISGRDAGEIAPFLAAREEARGRGTIDMVGNDLLLMGAYHRAGARLVIDIQLLDMDSWSNLKRAEVEGLYSKIPQINDSLYVTVRRMVKGLEFFAGTDIDQPIARPDLEPGGEKLSLKPARVYGEEAPAAQANLARAVEELESALDKYSGFDQPASATKHEGETYSREFSLEGYGALPEERARHTEMFEDVLRRVADNPYAADIGELELEMNTFDYRKAFLRIPVTYSVKDALLEDMLYSIPYVSTQESGRLRTIRYDRSRFDFPPRLIKQVSQGNYRVTPVIQLLNKQGQLRVVIVDSPDYSWEQLFPRNSIRIVRQKNFIAMLAVTTSGFNVDVRMETADIDVDYELELDTAELAGFSKVLVHFMKDQELTRFLRRL
jgi:TolB-like protein